MALGTRPDPYDAGVDSRVKHWRRLGHTPEGPWHHSQAVASEK